MSDVVQIPSFAVEGNNCTIQAPSTQHMISDEQLTTLSQANTGLAKDFFLVFLGALFGLLPGGIAAFNKAKAGQAVAGPDLLNLTMLAVAAALLLALGVAWLRTGSTSDKLVAEIRARKTAKVMYQ